jgi:NAD(P)H dehydrogenase (quinone)
MKVLIVYYSTYGNVYKMAKLVAEGVREVKGAEPVIRTVPELIPQSVIESRDDMKAGRQMQKDVPLVTLDDFKEAGAIAFGTPTRFGNVSAQLKNQIDQHSRCCGLPVHWRVNLLVSLSLQRVCMAGRKRPP